MTQASASYKQALMSYLALAGPTTELTIFHLKLLDIIDAQFPNNEPSGLDSASVDRPAITELMSLAFVLMRLLATHVNDLLAKLSIERRDHNLEAIRFTMWTQIIHIDQTPDLDRYQAQRMLVRSLNIALRNTGVITGAAYPNLEMLG